MLSRCCAPRGEAKFACAWLPAAPKLLLDGGEPHASAVWLAPGSGLLLALKLSPGPALKELKSDMTLREGEVEKAGVVAAKEEEEE